MSNQNSTTTSTTTAQVNRMAQNLGMPAHVTCITPGQYVALHALVTPEYLDHVEQGHRTTVNLPWDLFHRVIGTAFMVPVLTDDGPIAFLRQISDIASDHADQIGDCLYAIIDNLSMPTKFEIALKAVLMDILWANDTLPGNNFQVFAESVMTQVHWAMSMIDGTIKPTKGLADAVKHYESHADRHNEMWDR